MGSWLCGCSWVCFDLALACLPAAVDRVVAQSRSREGTQGERLSSQRPGRPAPHAPPLSWVCPPRRSTSRARARRSLRSCTTRLTQTSRASCSTTTGECRRDTLHDGQLRITGVCTLPPYTPALQLGKVSHFCPRLRHCALLMVLSWSLSSRHAAAVLGKGHKRRQQATRLVHASHCCILKLRARLGRG